jgi:hypothetical protein
LPPYAAPNQHGAAAAVKVALLQSERFADPRSRTPEQDDQPAKPVTVGTIADRAHDGDDLLNCRWIGRVLLARVARRAPSVIAGHRRRRAAMPRGVQQHGFHESSLRWG